MPQIKKGLLYYVIVFTPCILIINLGLGSQQEPLLIAGFPINQIINWFVILGTAIIIRNTYNNNLWPLILISLVILSKIVSKILGDPVHFHLFYKIMSGTMFLVLGTIYAHRYYYRLIYKPVLVICFINVIWMVFQMLNLGPWTQFLATEQAIPDEKITYNILFSPIETLRVNVIQSRPSGLLRSNNILSGVLLFALAIHLSWGKRILRWGTIVLCAMIVLASARVVYTGFILMGLMLLAKGSRYKKKHLMYCLLIIGVMLWLYSIFFPGLFDRYWTYDRFFYSFFIRINDIVNNMSLTNIKWFLKDTILLNTPVAEWVEPGSMISGYTILSKNLHYWPFFLISFLVLSFYYKKGFQIQRIIFPQLTWLSSLCLLVCIVYLAAVPMLIAQFYWFIGGFALLPFSVLLEQKWIHYTG
ncbi:MAG: hypothetical protein ISS28_05510 [Candidatus Cloacimonetes bacterium]|nr:hypothetical protein [Candidatus Cloacimonadota bacterium]